MSEEKNERNPEPKHAQGSRPEESPPPPAGQAPPGPRLQTFGLIGLLLGPVVKALAISTLRIYGAEAKGRHAEGEART